MSADSLHYWACVVVWFTVWMGSNTDAVILSGRQFMFFSSLKKKKSDKILWGFTLMRLQVLGALLHIEFQSSVCVCVSHENTITVMRFMHSSSRQFRDVWWHFMYVCMYAVFIGLSVKMGENHTADSEHCLPGSIVED